MRKKKTFVSKAMAERAYSKSPKHADWINVLEL